MASINFPNSPTINDEYTFNGVTYIYKGSDIWIVKDEADFVTLTGDQTIEDVKTFTSIPVLPASNPTAASQAARKQYVDDQATATLTLTNKTLTNPTLTGYTETVFTITDAATVTINPDNGTIQLWTLGANRTLSTGSMVAGKSVLLMVDDGTARTITWSTVVWVGGSAPTLATSGYTCIELWRVGTTTYGALVGNVA